MPDRPETTEGLRSERVFAAGLDEDVQALRLWAWVAVQRAGGQLVLSHDDYFKIPPGATLRWKVDPATLSLTIVADDTAGAASHV